MLQNVGSISFAKEINQKVNDASTRAENVFSTYYAKTLKVNLGAATRNVALEKKQLQKEAVDELKSAGYDAYSVNSVSFNDVEEKLSMIQFTEKLLL